jgi:hypothetical protein
MIEEDPEVSSMSSASVEISREQGSSVSPLRLFYLSPLITELERSGSVPLRKTWDDSPPPPGETYSPLLDSFEVVPDADTHETDNSSPPRQNEAGGNLDSTVGPADDDEDEDAGSPDADAERTLSPRKRLKNKRPRKGVKNTPRLRTPRKCVRKPNLNLVTPFTHKGTSLVGISFQCHHHHHSRTLSL